MATDTATIDERAIAAALRARDEAAFVALVEAHGAAMWRFALTLVRSATLADDVVQDAWLGALRGIDRFEGRSSLRTWLFQIVANTAKTRAVREARSMPFSALFAGCGDQGPAVSGDRFFAADGKYPGGWTSFPRPWEEMPDSRLLADESRAVIDRAIAQLPEGQRLVITLRDVEGWEADEVCHVLKLSETNQRVLLHRARSRVRSVLEDYLAEE